MPEEDECKGCSHRQSCKEVYRQLGRGESAPGVLGAVAAFLLPIVIFIATLAAGQALLKRLNANIPAVAVSLILAFLVTACYVFIARVVVKKRAERIDK